MVAGLGLEPGAVEVERSPVIQDGLGSNQEGPFGSLQGHFESGGDDEEEFWVKVFVKVSVEKEEVDPQIDSCGEFHGPGAKVERLNGVTLVSP